MPRYFFTLEGDGSAPDDEGVILVDHAAARLAAVLALSEALKDGNRLFWTKPEWILSVANEQGRDVCRLRVEGWATTA